MKNVIPVFEGTTLVNSFYFWFPGTEVNRIE